MPPTPLDAMALFLSLTGYRPDALSKAPFWPPPIYRLAGRKPASCPQPLSLPPSVAFQRPHGPSFTATPVPRTCPGSYSSLARVIFSHIGASLQPLLARIAPGGCRPSIISPFAIAARLLSISFR